MYITLSREALTEQLWEKTNNSQDYGYKSYEASERLAEELEGSNIEFDLVAIHCDWSDMNEKDIINDYKHLIEDIEEDLEVKEESELLDLIIEELENKTTVLKYEFKNEAGEFENGYLIFNF
jgi:hypothetical protein